MKQRTFRAFGYCESCCKYLYLDRKTARKVSRQHHGEHKSPYRCPDNNLLWHTGNLDKKVIRGQESRRHRYGSRDAA